MNIIKSAIVDPQYDVFWKDIEGLEQRVRIHAGPLADDEHLGEGRKAQHAGQGPKSARGGARTDRAYVQDIGGEKPQHRRHLLDDIGLAAELLGVRGVRMYHDQALYKEAGGGITPWHADQYYWPLSSALSVTAWIPLQAVTQEMGPLAFSIGSHQFEAGRELAISDESEALIGRSLKERNYPLNDTPFDLGEVSFHYGWTFHRAGPNTTKTPRAVMTIIYMDEDMRLIEPKTKAREGDRAYIAPDVEVGAVLNGKMTPVIYHAK